MSKIIDCITFYDNNFIFDFRYNVINEFVDKFIICESIFDHRNQKKNKNFDLTGKYKNNPKIMHIILEKPFPKNTNEWENQAIQREFILDHLDFAEWLLQQKITSISLNPDTVIETWNQLGAL